MSACATSSPDGTKWQGVAPNGSPVTLSMENAVCCVSNACPNGLSACLTVKPVGEPDALIGHVRFDERGWETERCRMAQATAPILDSTFCDMPGRTANVRYWGKIGLNAGIGLRAELRRELFAAGRQRHRFHDHGGLDSRQVAGAAQRAFAKRRQGPLRVKSRNGPICRILPEPF